MQNIYMALMLYNSVKLHKTTEKENNHLNAHNASQRFFKNFTSSEVKELFCQPIVQLCAHSHTHGGPQGGPGPLSALRQLR